jgi:hypothetical protein
MNHLHQYVPGTASSAQLCRLWSDHVDALDRHLSANTWALAAVTMVLIAYPIADLSSTWARRQKSSVHRARSRIVARRS